MRHRNKGRKLNRTSAHRKSLIANMAASLIQHERVVTTPPKAKEVRQLVEKLISMSKKGGLPERRRALALLGNRRIEDISKKGNPVAVKVTKKLFDELGPRFMDRNGGYTRILRIGGSRKGDGPNKLKYRLNDEPRTLRLSGRRLGDNAEQCILEFVDNAQAAGTDEIGSEE